MDGSRTDGLIHAAGRAGTGMTAKEPKHLARGAAAWQPLRTSRQRRWCGQVRIRLDAKRTVDERVESRYRTRSASLVRPHSSPADGPNSHAGRWRALRRGGRFRPGPLRVSCVLVLRHPGTYRLGPTTPRCGDDLGVHSTAGLDWRWLAVGIDLGIQSARRSQEIAFSKLAPVRYRWLRAGAWCLPPRWRPAAWAHAGAPAAWLEDTPHRNDALTEKPNGSAEYQRQNCRECDKPTCVASRFRLSVCRGKGGAVG